MLLVHEIFYSIQGETSQTGLPYVFIRLTGCNLRCTYCDTAHAFHGGTRMEIPQVLQSISQYDCRSVLITGGEPLMQKSTAELVDALNANGYFVSIETHGEVSIEPVAKKARIVMDIKTPGSGMCREGFKNNLRFLTQNDEIKFVITSKEDYAWAKSLLLETKLPTKEILLSPAILAKDQPGKFEGIEPKWLAEQILNDRLAVRFQLQLHKQIWGAEARGV